LVKRLEERETKGRRNDRSESVDQEFASIADPRSCQLAKVLPEATNPQAPNKIFQFGPICGWRADPPAAGGTFFKFIIII
jgi:hypothetical protein